MFAVIINITQLLHLLQHNSVLKVLLYNYSVIELVGIRGLRIIFECINNG